jgi:hypothetical protein
MNTARPAPLPSDSLAFAVLESARLIEAVMHGRNLTEALALATAGWPNPAQRGAIMDLTYGTLRDFGRGDFLLASCSTNRSPNRCCTHCCWWHSTGSNAGPTLRMCW